MSKSNSVENRKINNKKLNSSIFFYFSRMCDMWHLFDF